MVKYSFQNYSLLYLLYFLFFILIFNSSIFAANLGGLDLTKATPKLFKSIVVMVEDLAAPCIGLCAIGGSMMAQGDLRTKAMGAGGGAIAAGALIAILHAICFGNV